MVDRCGFARIRKTLRRARNGGTPPHILQAQAKDPSLYRAVRQGMMLSKPVPSAKFINLVKMMPSSPWICSIISGVRFITS